GLPEPTGDPPLRELWLNNQKWSADQLRELLAWPGLSRLGLLELGVPLGDAGARVLARGAPASLTGLRLAVAEVGPAGVGELAASGRLEGLLGLVLDRNPLGEAGARALAGSRHLRRLVRLSLDRCELHGAALATLANSPVLESVERLALWLNPLGPEGGQP